MVSCFRVNNFCHDYKNKKSYRNNCNNKNKAVSSSALEMMKLKMKCSKLSSCNPRYNYIVNYHKDNTEQSNETYCDEYYSCYDNNLNCDTTYYNVCNTPCNTTYSNICNTTCNTLSTSNYSELEKIVEENRENIANILVRLSSLELALNQNVTNINLVRTSVSEMQSNSQSFDISSMQQELSSLKDIMNNQTIIGENNLITSGLSRITDNVCEDIEIPISIVSSGNYMRIFGNISIGVTFNNNVGRLILENLDILSGYKLRYGYINILNQDSYHINSGQILEQGDSLEIILSNRPIIPLCTQINATIQYQLFFVAII